MRRMHKTIFIFFFSVLPLVALAQASGGQIRRQNVRKTQVKSRTNSRSQNNRNHKDFAKPVDLGLPSGTLWADRNVGANSPTSYGGLYRYGAPYTKLDGSDSKMSFLSNIIDSQHDVAKVNMGDDWLMPSKNQAEELIAYCDISKQEVNGIKVAKCVGPNGNYILLPLGGVMYNYGRSQADDFGDYMLGEKDYTLDLFVWMDEVKVGLGNVDYGLSVRAVYHKSNRPSTVPNDNSSYGDACYILISCGVPTARISIDGQPYERTGHKLTKGVHRVRISAEGYDDLEDNIMVDSSTRNFSFKLIPNRLLLYRSNLSDYNVVVESFSILDNAKRSVQQLRGIGYDAYYYLDSKGIYRVIIGRFADRLDALNCSALFRSKNKTDDVWILCVINGKEERYNQ